MDKDNLAHSDPAEGARDVIERELARQDARDQKAAQERRKQRPPEQIDHVARLHGGDRSGLGPDGWAEVADDLIGGHPELEDAPASLPDGALNGRQPGMNPRTGAAMDASAL